MNRTGIVLLMDAKHKMQCNPRTFCKRCISNVHKYKNMQKKVKKIKKRGLTKVKVADNI